MSKRKKKSSKSKVDYRTIILTALLDLITGLIILLIGHWLK